MRELKANKVFQTTSDKIALQTLTIPAKLEYSVDAVTWTVWKEQITENNVVISNIPVGLYIKLNQDCVITDK